MSNNSSSILVDCDTDWYSLIGIEIEVPVYYVLYPSCIVLAIIGRLACLIGFYRQSKKEPAYFYQVAITIEELFELVTAIGYSLVMICGWNPGGSDARCLSNYSYMWYMVHLAVPLLNMTYMIKHLQAIFMAADRVIAIWKPTVYINLKHTRLRVASVLISLLLGISTSLFDCFRYSDPQPDPGGTAYILLLNIAFLQTTTAKVLSRIRDAVRFGGLIALIVLNVIMIRLFRKHARQIGSMLGQTEEVRKQRRQARGDRTLLLVTISQCVFSAISIFSVVAYYIILSAKPTFEYCQGLLWGPIMDILVRASEVAQFVFVFVISKHFRRLILCFESDTHSSHHQ